ncbi:hypothetical protein BKA65DRAFT_473181 [Rhexocercosporidium sp. MPI-PUGE-AT-0058]|nr:hypothetical protein BKA65DRAFT_473181 [Rhexocercosporidium sp. MPI-PUGE-AT-0058]
MDMSSSSKSLKINSIFNSNFNSDFDSTSLLDQDDDCNPKPNSNSSRNLILPLGHPDQPPPPYNLISTSASDTSKNNMSGPASVPALSPVPAPTSSRGSSVGPDHLEPSRREHGSVGALGFAAGAVVDRNSSKIQFWFACFLGIGLLVSGAYFVKSLWVEHLDRTS